MKTTNVKPTDLNYHNKPNDYDRDILAAIPFHAEIQQSVADTAHKHFGDGGGIRILDLGVGTGLTSKAVRILLPQAQLTVIDFSSKMLDLARQRLGEDGVEYICADYSELALKKMHYHMVISVISLHHQTDCGKERVIKQVYQTLLPMGVFLLGDLVTHGNPKKKALNDALHYHHMVEHNHDEKTLADWAYHHKYLNQPATTQQQLGWMQKAGFARQRLLFSKFNTALMLAVK